MNASVRQPAFIISFHTTRGLLTTITAVVLVTFVTLNLQPLAMAAQTSVSPGTAREPQGLSERLQALKETVRRTQRKITESAGGPFDLEADLDSAMQGGRLLVEENIDDTVADILEQAEAIEAEHDKAVEEFDRTGHWIQDQDLPPVIEQRHEDAVAEYQAKYNTYQQHVEALSKAAAGKAQQQAIQDLDTFLKDQQFQRSHQPFDPEHLPFRVPDGQVREPATTKEQFKQLGLVQDTPIQVAATELSPMMLAQAEDLPRPEHLQPTIDVQITQAIRDQAEALNHHPVEIYNWVRNTIEFLPTYGSIQGSDLTLLTQRGNAFDTASLLIALLRASDIPARYVYGTVEIPIEQVMNWVGDADTPQMAVETLAAGGTAVTSLISGGRVVAARFEHVWVETWVDFVPSRGAVNKQGDTWVPLDGSFKQYVYHAPIPLDQLPALDDELVTQALLDGAVIDEDSSSVTALNRTAFESVVSQYGQALQSHVEANFPDATVGDLLGRKEVVLSDTPVLATGLPYKVVAIANRFPAYESSHRHSVTIDLYTSDLERSIGSPILSHSVDFPALKNSRVGVTFQPASDADQTLIDTAIAKGQTSLPLYLIQGRSLLQIDGVTIAQGPITQMGEEQIWTISFNDPAGLNGGTDAYRVALGDEVVFGFDGNGMTPPVIGDRLIQDPSLSAAENLQQSALHYWVEHDFFSQLAASRNDVITHRMPSVGLFSSPLTVSFFFGLPRTGTYQGRQVDVKRVATAAVAPSREALISFTTQAGSQGSYLEGSVLDQLFARPQGTAVSAVQLIALANAASIPIHTITNTNVGSLLPQLSTSNDVISDILSAVAVGLEVIVPHQDINTGTYTGIGYIVRDPNTGAAAYRIDGGLDGAVQGECGDSAQPRSDFQLAFASPLLTIIEQSPLLRWIKNPALIRFLLTRGAFLLTPVSLPVALVVSVAVIMVVYMIKLEMAMQRLERPESDEDRKCDNGECTVEPRCPHLGGDLIHDTCADEYPPNEFFGCDAKVTTPEGEVKRFDAINGNTLWEIKTRKWNEFLKFTELPKKMPEWIQDSRIARRCGYKYVWGVADPGWVDGLEEFQQSRGSSFTPAIADGVKEVNCLISE